MGFFFYCRPTVWFYDLQNKSKVCVLLNELVSNLQKKRHFFIANTKKSCTVQIQHKQYDHNSTVDQAKTETQTSHHLLDSSNNRIFDADTDIEPRDPTPKGYVHE